MLSPEPFMRIPPAFYWGSPFWRASIPNDLTEGSIVPSLPSFDIAPSLDPDQVWRFIANERRRGWFYRLLCAVIHSGATKRRVVIVDTPEHVALWVAAISLALPPRYRPLLSFATYHHDPYQADYLITGVRPDGDFKLAPADFLSFFTLDTETGRISETADSPYARFAAGYAQPDLYSERMPGLLGMCDRLFPPDGAIGSQLDDAAAYYTRVLARSGPVDPAARRALTTAITTLDEMGQMGQTGALGAEWLEDLQNAHTLLLTALFETPEPGLIQDYARILGALRSIDPTSAPACLPRDLSLVTRLIGAGSVHEGLEISETIRRVYGDNQMSAAFNSAAYLRELSHLSESAPLQEMLGVWQFAGAHVKAAPDSIPALVTMLKRASMPSGELTTEGAQAVAWLAEATHGDGLGWLTALVHDPSVPPEAMRVYYYALVSHMPPQERGEYRALMPHAETLPDYEIARDLSGDQVKSNLDALERWAEYARENSNGIAWVPTGLNYLWSASPPGDLPVIAKRALMCPVIEAQLSDQSIATLLRAALDSLPMARPSADDLAFLQRYGEDPRLSGAERALLTGVFAMYSGQLDRRSALTLRERFSQLSPEEYAVESQAFINRFFEQDVTRDAHAEMVVATYNARYNDLFWQNYGSALLTWMVDPQMARMVALLLSFWFDASLSMLGAYPYVVQLFFMGLPQLFEEAQKERGYRDAAPEIDRYASEQPWYPLVKGMIMPERKGLLGKLGL
jgi:hypothetical protein